MSRRPQDLARLGKLTEAAFMAAQTRLQKKAAAEAAVQAELDKLASDRRHVLEKLVISSTQSPAQIVCHGTWLTFAEQKRARLNTALAKARALALKERADAKRAFGRNKVVAELNRRAKRDTST